MEPVEALAPLSSRGAVAIFVKTPGYSPVKSRLAASLGAAKATEIYQTCVQTTAAVAGAVSASLQAYWAIAEAEAWTAPSWQSFPKILQDQGSLGLRMAGVYQRLLTVHPLVLLIGADCPHMPRFCLEDAVQRLSSKQKAPDFVLGLATDGGFYLMGGRTPLPSAAWTEVAYSQPRAAADLQRQLDQYGRTEVLPLRLTDLDQSCDLFKITTETAACHQAGYALLAEQLALKFA